MSVNVPQSAFIRRNRLAREFLRKILTSVARHRQGAKKDILLLSSRRSGSTWVMQSMGAAKRLRTVDEPFGPKFIGRSYLAKSPLLREIRKGHRLFAFPPEFLPLVDEYMAEPHHTKIAGPYDPFAPSFHLYSDRRLWKIIHANPAIGYFLERSADFCTFFLIRHPCPTILSMSRKYPCELNLILDHEAFCESHLTGSQFAFFKDIEKQGNSMERFAAEWALEQLVPWKLLPHYLNTCDIVSYEELKLNPEKAFRILAEKYSLEDIPAIIRAATQPSASTEDDRRRLIQSKKASDIIDSWRKRIDSSLEKRIFEIIGQVGIDYYEFGRNLPRQPYLCLDRL